MSYHFFALLGRMKYIDRWGLMSHGTGTNNRYFHNLQYYL